MKLSKTIKKLYENLTIQEIEKKLTGFDQNFLKIRKSFIEGLFYLQRTERFRENKMYKSADFQVYIYSMFNVSIATYYSERIAFINFASQVKKFGLGTVIKAVNDCGQTEAKKAFQSIGTKFNLTDINKAIKKYKRTIVTIDPVMTLGEAIKLIDQKDEELKSAYKTIHEQEEQINLLKQTVLLFKQDEKAA